VRDWHGTAKSNPPREYGGINSERKGIRCRRVEELNLTCQMPRFEPRPCSDLSFSPHRGISSIVSDRRDIFAASVVPANSGK